jgi:tetratricopeptide (TPR) repeat protein
VVVAATGPAVRAEPRPVTAWSRGVPEAAQARALQLFREGNVFLEQAKYTEAVPKYEQALSAWDHPNIRFNMAICLINMRQPLAAWNHLQQALRFGDAPLGKQHHAEAMTYVAVLEASLAQLTVRSTQPGIRVMVDGAQVLDRPGELTMRVLAGKHQLVASRPGYITQSRALDLPAGKTTEEQIALAPEKIEVRRDNYDRRWPWWAPWAVVGGGVVLGGAGAGIYVAARTERDRYDRAFAAMCPEGCAESTLPADLLARKANARRNSGVAIGMWVTAGVLGITGGVMAVLNRPYKLEERPAARAVTPSVTVSRDYVGVGLSLTLE